MRTKLKWKKIKIKVTFLPFPRRHKTIFSFIWTLNFIYSTSTTADTQSNVSEEIKWLLTLAQTVQQPLVFLELNWKQKPWSSSLNTVTMKPEPMLASCGLAGFGVQGFRLVKLSLSRQTEVDWSESKQAAMSPHSQLYCFTLQTILSIWLHKISVCVCVLVYDRQGSHNIHIRLWWIKMFWTLLLAGAWQNAGAPLHSSPRLFWSCFQTALLSAQALISGGEVYSCSEFSAPRSSEEEQTKKIRKKKNHTDNLDVT